MAFGFKLDRVEDLHRKPCEPRLVVSGKVASDTGEECTSDTGEECASSLQLHKLGVAA